MDYKKLHKEYFGPKYGATAPESGFTVTVKRNEAEVATGQSDSSSDLEVRTGDTLEIINTSTKGSGRRWSKCDFQISDGTRIIYSSTLLKEDDKG
ncbi:MAG TPA: hypothetical protein PLL98_10070, partial [Bacillota bacterium]|nr:hypothetical protein [Bacillota bacterium]